MKAENINVGEWVVDKKDKKLRKVIAYAEFLRMPPDCVLNQFAETHCSKFRRPTIADLNKGDVFEWEGLKLTFDNFGCGKCWATQIGKNDHTTVGFDEADYGTKVKIISLASEKVEPELSPLVQRALANFYYELSLVKGEGLGE